MTATLVSVRDGVVSKVSDSSGFAPPPPKPVYFGDIDEVLRKVSENIPIVDTERIYQWELEKQRKVYLAVMALGCVMIGFGLLMVIGGI